MMETYEDLTHDGTEVTCSLNPDTQEATVTFSGYIHFYFNPDFPNDAKAFFASLVLVRKVEIDEDDE